tara:strand:+ start:1812 stop:2909 length:1098 start_codon:yes stop_codon:yes gene_type:complete
MNKIVELLIDWDNEEFDDLGVEILSLVDNPAIQVGWQAFAEELSFRENAECPDGFEHQMPDGSYMCGKEHGYEEISEEILKLMYSDEFGESYDPENTVTIDVSKEQFSTIGSYLKGLVGLDILSTSGVPEDDEGVLKYRYSGPSAERNFCKAMLRANKVYTKEEIEQMSNSINTGFRGGHGAYSIFDFKGGKNCNHFWSQVRVFKGTNGRAVFVDEGRASGDAGQAASISNNYWAFSEDDKQIITGPSMVPNQYILRKDEQGNPFHVFFSEETIEKIAEKFFANSNHNNTDINHNGDLVQENTLLESWIITDPAMDKSTAMGFDLPKGSWMVSMRVNNKETWNKIKSGELSGYSVEGSFLEKLIK